MSVLRATVLLIAIALLFGCAKVVKEAPPAPASAPPEQIYPYATVRVFFATDRNQVGSSSSGTIFGSLRADVTYGSCDVSIPEGHSVGALERPSLWRFELKEDPGKHVVLLGTHVTQQAQFFSDVADRVRSSGQRNAFVFVHGYNVSFEDAARRTAQMAYDLGFDGAPVFYSWPSRGTPLAYTVDEQNIEWSQANLEVFLRDFFSHSEADNVYLIAHSMGSRALTRAVASLTSKQPEIRSRLKEVILAAPDIDADVFRRDIAPELAAAGEPVTLYASSADLALSASKKFHGLPRAGESGPGLVVLPGVETIDATDVDTSFLGHSYYGDERSVLSDMFYLINSGRRADERFGLRAVMAGTAQYWEFKK